LNSAVSFYLVFIIATLGGVALDFLNVDPIKALYWTAILNGLLAPFLLVALLLVSNDERIMQGQCSSSITRRVVMLATVVMFVAAIAMFLV
jgi:Mn2+/Fe2+ NRAMP family transporter